MDLIHSPRRTTSRSRLGWNTRCLAILSLMACGMPVWAAAPTVAIAPPAPSFILDNQTADPFENAIIADASSVTVTIRFPEGAGVLSGASGLTFSTSGGVRTYTLSNRATADATAGLRGLVFDPTDNRINITTTELLTFRVTATNPSNETSNEATVTLLVAPRNDAPSIAFSGSLPDIFDNESNTPFASAVITDPDAGDSLTATITYPSEDGVLVVGSGSPALTLGGGPGAYIITGPVGNLQSFIRRLVFDPTENRLPVEPVGDSADTTQFFVSVRDLAAANDSSTRNVTVRSFNDAPSLLGSLTSPIADNAGASAIFATLSVVDPDLVKEGPNLRPQPVTLVVENDEGAATAGAGGFVGVGDSGRFEYTGTASPSGTPNPITTALRTLRYEPVANRVPVGVVTSVEIAINATDSLGATLATRPTLAITSVNDAPSFSLQVSPDSVSDTSFIQPLKIVASDPDVGDTFVVDIVPVSDPSSALARWEYQPAGPIVGNSATEIAGAVGQVIFRPILRIPTNAPVTFRVRLSDAHSDPATPAGTGTNSVLSSQRTITIRGRNRPTELAVSYKIAFRTSDDPALCDQESTRIEPLAGVNITDEDATTLTVTLGIVDDPNGLTGKFFLPGEDTGANPLVFSGTPDEVSATIKGVTFCAVPLDNRVLDSQVTYAVSILVTDTTAASVRDVTRQIVVTSVNGAPVIGNVPALDDQPVRVDPATDTDPLLPFGASLSAGITLTNDDPNNVEVVVKITEPAKGRFDPAHLGGFVQDPAIDDVPSGVYRMATNSMEVLTSSLQGLRYLLSDTYLFPPDEPGQTTFKIEAQDSVLNKSVRELTIVVAEEPVNWLVTSAEDDDSEGTLRWVLDQIALARTANAYLTFALDEYPVVIRLDPAKGPLVLGRNLVLKGPGADLVSISGDFNGDGTGDVQLLQVHATVRVECVTLTHGAAVEGLNVSGGAAYVGTAGRLTLHRCVVRNSVALQWGGGIDVDGGSLVLDGCLVRGNWTDEALGLGGAGVALYTDRACSFINTTFSANQQRSPAGVGGGGLYVENLTPSSVLPVTVAHCTFAENTDATTEGATSIHANVFGSGVELSNSIFADGSTRNLDVLGAASMRSKGGNVSDDRSRTVLTQDGQPKDVTILDQTSDALLTTGILELPFDESMRPVPGYRLSRNSPAVGRALQPASPTDQLGFWRDNDPDAGAIERGALQRLVLNEINFSPGCPGTPAFLEFFVPRDSQTVDLSGLILRVNGSNVMTIGNGVSVSPGTGIIFADAAFVAAGSPDPTEVVPTPTPLGLESRGLIELTRPSGAVLLSVRYVANFVDPTDPTNLTRFSDTSATLAPQTRGCAFLPHGIVSSGPLSGTKSDFPEDASLDVKSPACSPGSRITTPFGSPNGFPFAVRDGFIVNEDVAEDLAVLVNDLEEDAQDRLIITGTSGTNPTTSKGAVVSILPAGSPGRGAQLRYDPQPSAILKALPVGAETVDTFRYTVIDIGSGEIQSIVSTNGGTKSLFVAPGHRLVDGQQVVISGSSTASYNGQRAAKVVNEDQFTMEVTFVDGTLEPGRWETVLPRDPTAASEAEVSITVLGANDPPVPVKDLVSKTEVNEDTPVRIMGGPSLVGIASEFDTDASYPVKPRVSQLTTLLGGAAATIGDEDTDPDSDDTTATLRVVGVVSTVGTIEGFSRSDDDGDGEPDAGDEVVVESPGHGLADGNTVLISGYTGYSGYNGFQKVVVVDADHFRIPVLYVDDVIVAGSPRPRGLWTILTDANRLQATTALGASVRLEIRADPLETSVVYNAATSSELNTLAVGESRIDRFFYAVSDSHGAVSIGEVELDVNGVNDAPVPVNDPPGLGLVENLVPPGKTLGETLSGLPISYYLPPASGTSNRTDVVLLGGEPVEPIPLADLFRTDEETVLVILGSDLTGNDVDVDGSDSLRVSAVDGPSLAGATVTLLGDGSVRYNPAGSVQLQSLSREEAFLDTFEVTITDDQNSFVRSWLAVLVVGVHDKPDAINDLASTDEDTPVTINPLLNDVDVDEEGPLPNNILRLIPEVKTTPLGALVTVLSDSFTYDPTNSAFLNGLALGQTATEAVPTTTMDGSFVFANDDAFQVLADTPEVVLEVLVNDQNLTGTGKPVEAYSDPGVAGRTGVTASNHGLSTGMLVHVAGYGGAGLYNRSHRVEVIDANTFVIPVPYVDNGAPKGSWSRLRISQWTQGSAGGVVEPDSALGGFVYNPAVNFVGDDIFAYTIQDDLGNSDRGLVRVRVVVNQLNGNLQAKPDQFTVARGQSPTLDVLANDNILPVPGQSLTITRIVEKPRLLGGGPLRDDVEIVGNTLRYLQNFGGSPSDYDYQVVFSYEVSGGGTARAVAEVVVRVVDRGGTLPMRSDAFAVLSGSNQNVLAVLENDRVLPGSSEPLRVDLVSTNPVPPFTVGEIAIGADGLTVVYTPKPGFVGEDSFQYRATDDLGGTGVARVFVAVGGLPTRNDFFAAPYDDPLVNDDGGKVSLDVLANDPVVGSATVNLQIIAVQPVDPGATPLGTVLPSADGKFVEFTPAAGREGEQAFVYTIKDQSVPPKTAQGRLVVIVARSSVRASSDVFSVAAGSSANALDVLGNDVAIPDRGRALTIVSVGTGLDAPNRGGIVTLNEARNGLVYTPANGFVGQEVFTYTMTDSRGTDTAKVVVNVGTGSLSASPDAFLVYFDNTGDQQFNLQVLLNDRVLPDDGQTIVITGIGVKDSNGNNAPFEDNAPTEHGEVRIAEGGGSLVYVARAGASPPYTERFTYEITDGTARRAEAEVFVRVESRVSARELETNDDAYTVARDSSGNVLRVLANDGVKPAGTADWSVQIGTAPGFGAVAQVSGQSIVFTPEPGFVGTVQFTYNVSDGIGGTATATVTVKVGDLVLSPDAFAAVTGSAYLLDVLANDAIRPETPAEDYFLVEARNPDRGGSVAVVDGLVRYQPAGSAPSYPYTERFEYVVVDDSGVPVAGTATVEVHLLGTDRDGSEVLMTILGVNDRPTLGVPEPGEFTITDKQTVAPFAGVQIADVDDQGQELLEVRVVLNDPAAGRLENLGGFAETEYGSGAWVFNGTGAQATAAIQGLVFVPTENYVTAEETWPFVFDILVTDPHISYPVASSVTVNVQAINDPPTVSGTLRGQPVHYLGSILPFASVLITEVDDRTLQPLLVTVSFDPTRGSFLDLAGFVLLSPGVYSFQGTAAEATAALRLLEFAPDTGGRLVVDSAWPPSSEETFFTITVDDGFADPVLDSNTSVIAYHSLITKVLTTDGSKPDNLGFAVGASRTLVAIGAPRDADFGRDAGSAYVREQNSGGDWRWGQVARLNATDPVADARFGHAVSVTDRTIAVGAPMGKVNNRAQGAVYVYEPSSATATDWQSRAVKIVAADGASLDEFGQAVSLNGTFLAVGARFDDDRGQDSGSVYIYRRTAARTWVLAAKITAPDGAAGDQFGYAVSLSGEWLAIGAPLDDDNGRDSGSGYVFRRTNADGTSWTLVKRILPTLPGGATDGAAGDFFGFSVAINNGNVIVGSPKDDDVGNDRGSAFVFSQNRGGANNWGQVAKLAPNQTLNVDQFGFSVSLDDDIAVVGMPFSGESNQSRWGSAWAYRRHDGGADAWGLFEKLDPPDNINNDEFGRSVAINCGTLAVGSRMDDTVALNAGAAYIYDLAFAKAPRVATPLPDQIAVEGVDFIYTIPPETFGDADADDPLTLRVTLSDGGALPAWMAFAPATGTLVGTPPGGSGGTLLLSIQASDVCGGATSTPLRIDIYKVAPPQLPEPGAPLTYEQWIARLLAARILNNPALEATIWGRLANPDGDSYNNLEEYAFGTRLFETDTGDGPRLLVTMAQDGRVAISFRRRTNDASIQFTLQYSVDLDQWTNASELPDKEEIYTPVGYDLEWVTCLVPADALTPNLFFRVLINTN